MSEFIPRRMLQSQSRTLSAVGLDKDVPPLRRTENGAIDIDYYLAVGRAERAKAAASLARKLIGWFRRRADRRGINLLMASKTRRASRGGRSAISAHL